MLLKLFTKKKRILISSFRGKDYSGAFEQLQGFFDKERNIDVLSVNSSEGNSSENKYFVFFVIYKK